MQVEETWNPVFGKTVDNKSDKTLSDTFGVPVKEITLQAEILGDLGLD
jgi:hypothetical protein